MESTRDVLSTNQLYLQVYNICNDIENYMNKNESQLKLYDENKELMIS